MRKRKSIPVTTNVGVFSISIVLGSHTVDLGAQTKLPFVVLSLVGVVKLRLRGLRGSTGVPQKVQNFFLG